ncbi:hypothetical protein ABZ682_17975 [Streptomyces griseoviridis]
MSFHKIAPVKKTRKPAQASKPAARKPAPKRAATRRPVGHQR